MDALWGELGKQLADRWFALLVLPGAAFLAVVATAHILGQPHALDVARLVHQISSDARNPAVKSAAGQIILLLVLLVGAAGTGLLAQALGSLIERLTLAAGWRGWPQPLRSVAGWWMRDIRRRRWDKAHAVYFAEYQKELLPDPALRPDPAVRRRAARRRDRVAVERPERPTWSGDRIQAAAIRLDRDFYLDLLTVWPYIWLTCPDEVRSEISKIRTALSGAATLAGWAVIYLAVIWWWWPAAAIAVGLAVAARNRFRAAADTYAKLLESSVRLYAASLAAQLGIDHGGSLTPQLGATLTRHLQTQLPPPTNEQTGT